MAFHDELWTDLLLRRSVAAAVVSEAANEVGSEHFDSAFDEAFASAQTKFDSISELYSSGASLQAVTDMFVQELMEDRDFAPLVAPPARQQEVLLRLKRALGRLYGEWKKAYSCGAASGHSVGSRGQVPLPWSSIDAFPEYVVGQIDNYVGASQEEQASARRTLEHTLLEKPLCAASIKFDGTCFGKMSDGCLCGRRQTLGACCEAYIHTTTAAADRCDIAAFRERLCKLLGRELGDVCVWGELMINPGFYEYKAKGLHERWLAFGAVCQIPLEADQAQNAQLAEELLRVLAARGLAHSISAAGQLRLCLCPELRKMLVECGCDVVEVEYPGCSQAQVVAQVAPRLVAGEQEGIVFVYERSGGQCSVRKWKNSSEGGFIAKKHAQLLKTSREHCKQLVTARRLDERVLAMVETMLAVAEASTNSAKQGKKALQG